MVLALLECLEGPLSYTRFLSALCLCLISKAIFLSVIKRKALTVLKVNSDAYLISLLDICLPEDLRVSLRSY